jgi:hypothetical protein
MHGGGPLAEGCALPLRAGIVAVASPGPGELHEVYDLRDAAVLWQPVSSAARTRYRDAVARRVGSVTPHALLARQQRIFGAAETPELAREATNGGLVLDGGAGRIAQVTCLESLLWERQAARYPMLEHPTEFSALVLRGAGAVRVYLSGADRVGQRIRQEVLSRVRDDLARGYTLILHLHNHPFLLGRRVGDRMWTTEETVEDVAGGLAPSLTDVQLYRSLRNDLGLQDAWVTNGLDTGRFDAADFARLAAVDGSRATPVVSGQH